MARSRRHDVIEIVRSTSLVQIADTYFCLPLDGSIGPAS